MDKLFKKIWDTFFSPKFIKYLVVGFSTVAIEYVVFLLLSLWFQNIFGFSVDLKSVIGKALPANAAAFVVGANTLAYIISFIYNYTLNRLWTFEAGRKKAGKQTARYAVLFIFNIVFSNAFIAFTGICLGVNPLVSKFVSIAMITTWNFLLYKFWVFRD